MKTEDLAILGLGGYLLYKALSPSTATTGAEGSTASFNPLTTAAPQAPAIVPSYSGPISTSVGVIPSAFSIPYNVAVQKVVGVGSEGQLYGEYTKNGLGYSGEIPQVAPAAKPIFAGLNATPQYTIQSWVGSISDKSVSSFYIQDVKTGITTKGYSPALITKMYNEGILSAPTVIKSYLGLK